MRRSCESGSRHRSTASTRLLRSPTIRLADRSDPWEEGRLMRTAATEWDPVEFTARLRACRQRYWDTHPFHVRMHQGALDKAAVQAWVANRWYYQKNLPAKNAAI